MEESGSGNISIPGTISRTTVTALEFDLNKTPPPSPPQQQRSPGGNDDGATADHRCGSYSRTQREMVECSVCVKLFHVECLEGREDENNWKCAKCSTECRGTKRMRRSSSAVSGGGGLGLLDMNASPPREVDDDDVEINVNPELESVTSGFKTQDTFSNLLAQCTLTSPNTRTNMQTAQLNLDIATQNAHLMYLQALKDYISEKRGVLGDGWRVKIKYSESTCKTFPVYCAPNGSKFDSMQKVAHYLGLSSDFVLFETNDNNSSIGKNMDKSSRSMSRVSNGGNGVEVDPVQNGNHGSELFLDGFPVQFEDFFITSIGKIDPQSSFHNTSQIWPVGYKSMWHDKLTGSIFVCTVLKNNCAPTFKINRYPCSKQPTPNASTIIYKPKCGPSGQPSHLTTESQHMSSYNSSGDLVGEFSVEGRSPSSAWQLVIETLLFACRQSFEDLNFLSFCCNHSVETENEHCYGSYGIASLDKFGNLTGQSQTNSIPRLILTVDQLDFSCMVLRRWLQPDRFGLDAEFVQELIEQLSEASTCSGYISLGARCQNAIAHTVGSGYFTVLRKYHSLPTVSDSIRENSTRPGPPGNKIASSLPPSLIGNVLQAYEFFLRFHSILGQEAPLSRQKLEHELLNPWINGLNYTIISDKNALDEHIDDVTKRSESYGSQSLLSNFHMAMVKMLVEDMLSKLVDSDPFNAVESKSRKVRKKNMDVKVNVHGQKSKIGLFPVNEITWPELARRYILVLLSMDDNFEDLEITGRVINEIFLCLSGNGGPLCGSPTGMAAIEADAVVLAEASKKIFSSMKSKIVDFIIDKKDLNINNSAIEQKRTDNKCPEWIKLLEPVRKQPTNVGAKIRNRVKRSLEKGPPEWATEMLLKSISKDVYKGNAAGPTKKMVVEVLEKVRKENPLTRKKTKESRVIRTVSDVIMKRCRMVLRDVAAQDENKFFFALMADSFLKSNEFDDDGNLEMISRPLDFRTIDLRLDAGSYGGSHESFIEDVREVMQNLRIKYMNKHKYLELIEKISKKLEYQYEQEVLTLVNKTVKYVNGATSSSEEIKAELNMMIADTIATTFSVAPWEVGICKICGKDENDHILLLCDRCDAEYHTYCLNPPLQRIPKSSWYCPPCILFITSQSQSENMSREDDFDSMVLSQPTEKRSQREVVRAGLEALADLADNMESTEYWDLGVKERVSLLHFLCDEALSSTAIREYITTENCDVKRNFLGRDWAGRLYWTLGGPERLFVSGPHSDGETCEPSEEFDSWICYESDTEIEALVNWLSDDGARESGLKEEIMKWQKGKLSNLNGQVNFQVSCLRSSVYSNNVYRTNARVELEKKYGSVGEGRIVHEGKIKIHRCDCLELVGCDRHHCFLCHMSFFTNEVHQCETFGNQLTLTKSNKNPSFDNNYAFLVTQGVKLNELPPGFDRSNPEGITGKNTATCGPNENLLVNIGVNLNNSEHEVERLNFEGITGKSSSISSGPLMDRASEIVRCLKMILFDIETALPREAFRPSRVDSDKLRGWRAFLKSAQSIYEMVQATIIFEDMIKTEHLKKEWWHWSSPSAASKISTFSSLALHIYALDAAINYERPPPPPPPGFEKPPPPPLAVLTGPMAAGGGSKSKEETLKKSKLKNKVKLKSCTSTMKPNDPMLAPPPGFENQAPPPPLVVLTEPVAAGGSKSTEETLKKSKLKNKVNKLKLCTVNYEKPPVSPPPGYENPIMVSKSEDKPKKKKLKVTNSVVVVNGNDESLEVVTRGEPWNMSREP